MDLNRRSLIKGSVAAGVTALFGTAAQASTKVHAKWDESHDVVVIGSGFAGLAAAIEAKKAGADTVVLEKMPTAGGNSIINGGILTATCCRSSSSTASRILLNCSLPTCSLPVSI